MLAPNYHHPDDQLACLNSVLWDQERKGGGLSKDGDCLNWNQGQGRSVKWGVHSRIKGILEKALKLTQSNKALLQPYPIEFLLSYANRNPEDKILEMTGYTKSGMLGLLQAIKASNDKALACWRWSREHNILDGATAYEQFCRLKTFPC